MKKITIKNSIMLALLTIIAPIMALSSCSKDDDGDINVRKGRRLLMVESHEVEGPGDNNYIFHYEYDDAGRLSGLITESPSGSIATAWFTYDEHQLSWDYGGHSLKALISDSRVQWLEPRGIYFKYDSKGRIQECISENMHIQFVWDDDNIVKLIATTGEVTLKYTKIKAFDLAYQEAFNPLCVFGQQLNTYKWRDHFVYYTGLCGPFSKNMPSEMTWIANELYATGYHRQGILTYEYTTNSSGYPVGAVIKGVWNGGKERPTEQTMTMTWE